MDCPTMSAWLPPGRVRSRLVEGAQVRRGASSRNGDFFEFVAGGIAGSLPVHLQSLMKR